LWTTVIVVVAVYFGFCPAPENAQSFGSLIVRLILVTGGKLFYPEKLVKEGTSRA